MAKNYQALPATQFIKGSQYAHTGTLPEITHIDDPASDIFVDFKVIKAVTIAQDAPITDAKAKMKACGVHMLLVINHDKGVIGLITSEDILGEKPVLAAQQKFISRADVRVSMILTPAENVIAINYEELHLAKVGHIIQTLAHAKQHYALVIENINNDQQLVRGMFSLSDISRQLDKNVLDNYLPASTLIELNKKIDG